MAGHTVAGRRAWVSGRRPSRQAVDRAGRAGMLARGVTYAIVGGLAVGIAFGRSNEQADRSGALRTLSGEPYGAVLLWLLAAGFVGMTVWRLYVAAFGGQGSKHPARTRLASLARGAFYASVATSTIVFVLGDGEPKSSDQKSQDLTARVMRHTGGRSLVAVAGVAIGVAGLVLVWRGVRRQFEKNLRTYEMNPPTRRAVVGLGVAGNTARGAVFALVGVFVVRAAITFDPDQAKGLDSTLRSLAGTSLGPWLLVAVAAGLVAFGLYSVAEARWRRTT